MVYVQVYEPSIFSGHAASYAKKMSKSPAIEISIDPRPNVSQIYTTASPVTGKVIISSSVAAAFDEIQITLEGQTRVALEQMSQVAGHSTIEASHTFLKLNMPLPDAAYPVPRTVEANEPISVPFNFCIPAQLLPQACTHKCVADHVHDAHLQLPPSMDGMNDHTPDMGRVHYFIAAKLLRRSSASEKSHVLSTATRKFKVFPNVPQLPPLHIDASDLEYQLSRTKKLKKGLFKGRMGEVTISTSQPKPFVVTPSTETLSSPTTTASVTLEFHPRDMESKPPKIGSLSAKLKTSTYASVKAQKDLAKRIDHMNNFDPTRGIYSHSTTLVNMTIDSTTSWKYVADAPTYARRDSGYSTSKESSEIQHNGDACARRASTSGHYEAEILVPMSLPSNKSWLPTFHTCLVSRIYGLDIAVSVSNGSLPTTMNLRVPVQLSASAGDIQRRSSAWSTIEEMEESVEETLRPRLLSVPDVQFIQRSSIPGVPNVAPETELPPGYAGGFESYVRRESAADGRTEMGFE